MSRSIDSPTCAHGHALLNPQPCAQCETERLGHQAPTDRGHWAQTFTAGRFYFQDPRPEDIHILDVASGLSKNGRFTGQCIEWVSIAEHSVLVMRDLYAGGVTDPRALRQALFHDASEAYTGDLPRPLKTILPDFRRIEDRIMHAVALRFDFDWPGNLVLKEADDAAAMREVVDNMTRGPLLDHWQSKQPAGLRLQFWTPAKAMTEFLREAKLCGVEF